MQTQIADFLRGTPEGNEAHEILSKCVHCGFCTATCPTYQLLGDELDGPRGRIYLIKSIAEGEAPTEETRTHLDRCLTCRACEPACPSGVEYGRLADLGRKWVDERAPRPVHARATRSVLRAVLSRPRVFAALVAVGRVFAFLLPQTLRAQLAQSRVSFALPRTQHARKMLLLTGCVQPGLAPSIHLATVRVLDALGVQVVTTAESGCCGAIRHHLSDPEGALDNARRNIDAWWPAIEAGAEAIVMNASGCGAMVREYGHLLRHDPQYAAKAARVTELTRDLVEVVAPASEHLRAQLRVMERARIAFHPPCTLQHAQRLRGQVEGLLVALQGNLVPFPDAHLCCGSAGTYSLLQSEIASELRDRKLAALDSASPSEILSANIGCIMHLRAASKVPVRHWVEWLAERLP